MEVIHSINSHDFSNLPNLDNCSNFVTTFWSLVRECIDFTAIGPQQQQSQTQSQQQNQINSKNNNNSQNQIQNQTVSGLTQSQTQSQQRICNCYQFVPDPGKFSGLRNFFYFFLEEPIQQSSLSQSSQQTNPYSSERRLFFLSCTTRSKCFGVEDYHHHSKHNIRTVGGRIQNTLKNNNQNQNQMTTSQYSPQSSQSSQSQTSDDLLQDSQTANPNNSEPGPGTNVTTSRRTKNVNKRRKQNLNFKALSNLGPNNGGANHINNINYNNIDDDACSSSDFDKSVNNGDSSQLSECHSQSDQNLESLSLSISNSNLSMSQDDYNCCIYTDEEDSDAEMED